MDGRRPTLPADPWTREAVRLYRRYQMEIVEECGLCPWAPRARLDGKVRERVLLQTSDADVSVAVSAIQELLGDHDAEIALLIFPRIGSDRAAFERFVARVQEADARAHPLGGIPFVFAAFHPQAEPDLSHAERLVPFLRRTPDPTIQLLRAAAVDRVRAGTPQGTQFVDIRQLEADSVSQLPLRERIARTNHTTVTRMGLDRMKALLDAIVRDREETYRRLAGAP
jgi:hypothetical protein